MADSGHQILDPQIPFWLCFVTIHSGLDMALSIRYNVNNSILSDRHLLPLDVKRLAYMFKCSHIYRTNKRSLEAKPPS